MIDIKVCGMKHSKNVRDVLSLKPNLMGFIFYDKSKRYLEKPFLEEDLNFGETDRVGVFVKASITEIKQRIRNFDLQYVQLHGDESPRFCQDVSDLGVEVIKVFRVDESFSWDAVASFEGKAKFFLFDTKGSAYGGLGRKFNWDILQSYPYQTPYFLSGGIHLEDVEAIKALELPLLKGIDINSGFEREPGLKDLEKLKACFKEIRKMNFHVDENGFYGQFGGAFIPEMLHPNIEVLKSRYLEIMATPEFKEEFNSLLKDYVGRPTPLYKAERLGKKLGIRLYLKREDLCHTGAHKVNNTIGQVLVAKALGKKKIIAETGAGQHGVATATVCALMGLECIVYMGRLDTERQRPNVERMKILGATVSPVESGSKTLKDATNEAMRHWISNPADTHYIIGSVVGPHPYPDMVARFQSVISKEMRSQLLAKEGTELPDKVIACVGGGSNAAGAFYHYYHEDSVELVAVEASGMGVDSGESAATTVLGKPGILHGSRSLMMQTPDGQVVEPYSISAGLDYPGIGPVHAHLFTSGRGTFLHATDDEAMRAGMKLSQLEGIIPAIESAHALAALEKINFKKDELVILNLSGRGDKDLETYIKWREENNY